MKEHLEIFAILKGVEEDALERVVTHMVDQVSSFSKSVPYTDNILKIVVFATLLLRKMILFYHRLLVISDSENET